MWFFALGREELNIHFCWFAVNQEGITMRTMKMSVIIAGFLIAIPFVLPAQTAAELEAVLETQAVTCAQAARFIIASCPDALPEDASADADSDGAFEKSYELAVSRGWLKRTSPDDPIRLGKLSFLMMEAFHMKGGAMYSLLPGPRYAYRSMVSRNYIQGAADPSMTISGERFLFMLGKILNAEGGEQ